MVRDFFKINIYHVIVTLVLLGGMLWAGGAYAQRVPALEKQVDGIERAMGERMDRIEGQLTDIYNLLLEDRQ